MLQKENRAYNCIVFQGLYGNYICVPYRSQITHRNAYKFRNSKRSKKHKSGLDYSKTVILSSNEYIDNIDAVIDTDEYVETIMNIDIIAREVYDYLTGYIKHYEGTDDITDFEFTRKYGYSTLKYFHKELGIE